jgi:methylated-DNA-[protein]-cysteine S-methyltransferase
MMTTTTMLARMPSPLGEIVLRAAGDYLTGVFFIDQKYFPPDAGPDARQGTSPVLDQARAELEEFFAGRREIFSVPLRARGTPFQERVWLELQAIPYGERVSYGDIAFRLGLPRGFSRAVGSANGHNPIGIIVPCHRVVSSAGELTGYAGGVDRKAALLAIEERGAQASLF